MSKNKVKNTKTKIQPSDKAFNDHDMLLDTLTSLKHLNTEYGMLKTEASNKELADYVEKLAKSIGKFARDLFNLAFELGWYELTGEEESTITETYNKFKQNSQNM